MVYLSVQDVVGYMDVCYIRTDDRNYIGIYSIRLVLCMPSGKDFCPYTEMCTRFAGLETIWVSKLNPLPPDDIRNYIIPQYKH